MIDARDYLEIIALYAEYNRTIDGGEVDGWTNTFTYDGQFHHPSRTFSGIWELRQFVQDRTTRLEVSPVIRQRHWNGSLTLDGDGERAIGSCELVVVGVNRATGEPYVAACGAYEDQLERQAAGWRFRARRLTLLST